MRIGQDVSILVDSNDMYYVAWLTSPVNIQFEIMLDPNIDTWNLYHFFCFSLSRNLFASTQQINIMCALSVYL